jgi:hypothetical protein
MAHSRLGTQTETKTTLTCTSCPHVSPSRVNLDTSTKYTSGALSAKTDGAKIAKIDKIKFEFEFK